MTKQPINIPRLLAAAAALAVVAMLPVEAQAQVASAGGAGALNAMWQLFLTLVPYIAIAAVVVMGLLCLSGRISLATVVMTAVGLYLIANADTISSLFIP